MSTTKKENVIDELNRSELIIILKSLSDREKSLEESLKNDLSYLDEVFTKPELKKLEEIKSKIINLINNC